MIYTKYKSNKCKKDIHILSTLKIVENFVFFLIIFLTFCWYAFCVHTNLFKNNREYVILKYKEFTPIGG